MALRSTIRLLRQATSTASRPALQQQQNKQILLLQQQRRAFHKRSKSTAVSADITNELQTPKITSVIPTHHETTKIIFDSHQTADFKNIWLRDNCDCPQCLDPNTRQRLVDSPSLDINIKPKATSIIGEELHITWADKEQHQTVYSPAWLYKYGQSFIHNTFETDALAGERPDELENIELWDRTSIWKNLPEMSYEEFMRSEEGLRKWLAMFFKYGIAFLRGVPTEKNKITEVVERFAYVKETSYGRVFDVLNLPVKGAHLAYSGHYLAHHTDMNYREKSPGMQLLHCLKANDPTVSGEDFGGRSFFVDGFMVAKWLEEFKPAAYHILTSIPVRFSIKNSDLRYSAQWPIICTNQDGDVTEIHCNNRTMQPLQAPTHVITPFYHAYKTFVEKMKQNSSELELNMVPGDLVAFNNRRILHGRTSFDASKVDRHLQGCYVDIDESLSKLDQLDSKTKNHK